MPAPDKSALAKHAWENDDLIKWDDSEPLVPVKNISQGKSVIQLKSFKTKQSCEKASLFMTL